MSQSLATEHAKKILHDLDAEVIARCNAATAHGTNSKPILRLYRTLTDLHAQAMVYECEEDVPRAYMMYKTRQKIVSKERVEWTKTCNACLEKIEKIHKQLAKLYEEDYLQQQQEEERERQQQQEEERRREKEEQERRDFEEAARLAQRLKDVTPSPPPPAVSPSSTSPVVATAGAASSSSSSSSDFVTPASIPYPSIAPPPVAANPASLPTTTGNPARENGQQRVQYQSMQPQSQSLQPRPTPTPQQLGYNPTPLPPPAASYPIQPQQQFPSQMQAPYETTMQPQQGMRYPAAQMQPQYPPANANGAFAQLQQRAPPLSSPYPPPSSFPSASAPDLGSSASRFPPNVAAAGGGGGSAAVVPSSAAGRQRKEPVISETLRPVHLPTNVLADFYSFAQLNTDANIETCGILCGKFDEKSRDLWITHVIIPNQSATADTCVTTDEEQLIAIQIQYDLLTLGWIHTHPSQTCFLSSIDMHTHFSYQLMLNEAIAIVLAPKHEPKSGVFHCTLQGMKALTHCSRTGFHKHEDPFPLYAPAPHYRWEADPKHKAKFMDLRPRNVVTGQPPLPVPGPGHMHRPGQTHTHRH